MTFIIRIMGDGALNAKPIFYHLTTKIQRWSRKCISDISSGISGISSGIFMYFSNYVQFQITTHIYIHVMSVQSDGEEMLEHFHGISRAFPGFIYIQIAPNVAYVQKRIFPHTSGWDT